MNTVIFEKGRNGGVMCMFQGKVSFPEKLGPQPQAGEEWEVVSSSTKPSGTVNFLKLGRKIEIEKPTTIRSRGKLWRGSSGRTFFDVDDLSRNKIKNSLKNIGSIYFSYKFYPSFPIKEGIWEVDVEMSVDRKNLCGRIENVYSIKNVHFLSFVKSLQEVKEEEEKRIKREEEEKRIKREREEEERCRDLFGGLSLGEVRDLIKKHSVPILDSQEWETCEYNVRSKCQNSRIKDLGLIESRIKDVVHQSNEFFSFPNVMEEKKNSWYHSLRWYVEDENSGKTRYVFSREVTPREEVQLYVNHLGIKGEVHEGYHPSLLDDGDGNTQYGHYID